MTEAQARERVARAEEQVRRFERLKHPDAVLNCRLWKAEVRRLRDVLDLYDSARESEQRKEEIKRRNRAEHIGRLARGEV